MLLILAYCFRVTVTLTSDFSLLKPCALTTDFGLLKSCAEHISFIDTIWHRNPYWQYIFGQWNFVLDHCDLDLWP